MNEIGKRIKFPEKLHNIIREGKTNAIKWNDDGDIVLISLKEFEKEYLHDNKYFSCGGILSIIRQLNLYQFRKIKKMVTDNKGYDQYHHPFFKRDRPDYLKEVLRCPKEPRKKKQKKNEIEVDAFEDIKSSSSDYSLPSADPTMDLDQLKAQMNIVIQKHQMVVSEMKKDPQNSVLKKQLHDLNSEIMNVSEKQKHVMQQLRNNLQQKPCPITSNSQHVPQPNTFSVSQAQDGHSVCSAQNIFTNHKISTPIQAVPLATKQVPNFVNSVRQPVPPSTNNLVSSTPTLTFKSPMATVMLPNCSGTPNLLTSKSMDNQKLHPVLVVPSPSNRGTDGSQTGVLLNIVPPIRVPQYPPPIAPRPNGPLKCQSLSTPVPVSLSFATTTCVSSPKVAPSATELQAQKTSSLSQCSNYKTMNNQEKTPPIKIDPKKKDYMLSLGLVSKDYLQDLKNKKNERKRRTTANPQFSNAALEEKLRIAAATQALVPPTKRPRGRPRLDSKPLGNFTNGTQPDSPSNHNCASPSTSNSDKTSPPSTPFTPVVNGIHRQSSPNIEDKRVEELLSNLCIVCTQPGDLIKCDTCAKQQHPGCMQPPLPEKPAGQWQCSDCQNRADTLAAVHSYEMLKAAKEDEKRKLLKKSLELRSKKSQLEVKLTQLKELAKTQKDTQSEMELASSKIKHNLDAFQNAIKEIMYC